MKRLIAYTSTLFAVACMTAFTTAQDTNSRDRVRRDTARATASQAGNLDGKTTGANIRASQLIGMNIQNSAGEGVGEINDIVLDANTGRVRYAAVTYGGILGVGNKMFAVPFEAFKCQRDPDDRDEHIVILDVTQKQLEGAKGFDEDNWPNFADRKFTMELDKRYGVERRRDRQARRDRVNRDVDVDVRRDEVKVDVDDK